MEPSNYHCQFCNYSTNTKCNYNRHNNSEKHKLKSCHANSSTSSETTKKVNESDNDDIKKLMEMINKQNKIIQNQNDKIEMLENKIETLLNDKIDSQHITADICTIFEQMKYLSDRSKLSISLKDDNVKAKQDNKPHIHKKQTPIFEQEIQTDDVDVNSEEEMIEMISVDEHTLEQRRKERKRRENEIIAYETEKEQQLNKVLQFTISTSLIQNFKPINPPTSYIKKALEFIRKMFSE